MRAPSTRNGRAWARRLSLLHRYHLFYLPRWANSKGGFPTCSTGARTRMCSVLRTTSLRRVPRRFVFSSNSASRSRSRIRTGCIPRVGPWRCCGVGRTRSWMGLLAGWCRNMCVFGSSFRLGRPRWEGTLRRPSCRPVAPRRRRRPRPSLRR